MYPADYRQSHLEKGADYDAALAGGTFDSYMTTREAILLPRIVTRLFPAIPPKYLDFACGTGRITSLVAPLSRQSRGVDVSEAMVGEARRKCPNTRFDVRDITTELLDDTDFELITAFRFFGNAQPDLRRAALRAVSRHLVRGGYFVFNNHRNYGSLRARLQRATGRYEDVADLDLAMLRDLLRDAGLSIEFTTGIGWWLVAHRFDMPGTFGSSLVGAIEPLSTRSWMAPYCPAYIVVARNTGEPRGVDLASLGSD
jgi:SAM-dependent methyltransferase